MNRDNQQEIHTKEVTNVELAWLAGMLNGDGCFHMSARKKSWKGRDTIGVDMRMVLTQTDAGIIEKASGIITRLTGHTPYIAERKPAGAGVNGLMHMSIGRMVHMDAVLEAIRPYLVGDKAARARLIGKYIKSRLSKMGEHPKNKNPRLCKEDWALVEQFYEHEGKSFHPEVEAILRG